MQVTKTPSGGAAIVIDLVTGISDDQRAWLTPFDLAFVELCAAEGQEKVVVVLAKTTGMVQ